MSIHHTDIFTFSLCSACFHETNHNRAWKRQRVRKGENENQNTIKLNLYLINFVIISPSSSSSYLLTCSHISGFFEHIHIRVLEGKGNAQQKRRWNISLFHVIYFWPLFVCLCCCCCCYRSMYLRVYALGWCCFFLQTKQAKNNSYTRPWWTITANRNNNNKKGTQRFQKRLMSPSLQIDTKCDTVIWYFQWHFRILFPFIRSTHSTDFGCVDTNSISINDARQCANILALLLCECNVATINNALYMIIIYI